MVDTLKLGQTLVTKVPQVLLDPTLKPGKYRVRLVVSGPGGDSDPDEMLIVVREAQVVPLPTPVVPLPTPVIPLPTPVIPLPTPVIPHPTPVVPGPSPGPIFGLRVTAAPAPSPAPAPKAKAKTKGRAKTHTKAKAKSARTPPDKPRRK